MTRALICLLIAVAVAVSLSAAASEGSIPATASCHLSTHDERHLGASYVTSLKVSGTSCAKGKSITLAFNRCRTSSGKPQGECHRKVGHYTCSEHRYDAVPHVQYNSSVTCVWGSKRVWSTYTQNT